MQRWGWRDVKQVGKQLQTENIKMGLSNVNQLELPNGEYGKFGEGISSCTFKDVFEYMLKSGSKSGV